MDQEILVNDAVKLTGYTRTHIYGLITAGDVEARKLGHQYLINRKSLLAYVKSAGRQLPTTNKN